jgi:arylsulfatase A-like enzyme
MNASPFPGAALVLGLLLAVIASDSATSHGAAEEPAGRTDVVNNAAYGKRPNIIFILTDDLGYGDIGVFYQNQRNAKGEPCEFTPHLDAMAAQGIQLRDHYTSAPVCAPARGTLLAGVHQGNAGVRDNQFDKALENNHTLATVLKAAGYSTAAIGKWGLQGAKELPKSEDEGVLSKETPANWSAYPTKRGFDYYFGYVRHRDGHEHYPKEGVYGGRKQVWDMDREIAASLAGCYTADLFTARAKKWITDQHAAQPTKPFFLYLAFDTPHAVLEYPAMAYPAGGGLKGGLQWLGRSGEMINTASGKPDSYCYPEYANATYAGPTFPEHGNDASAQTRPWPELCKRYASSVRRIDDCVGDLMQLLRDLHIDDNTLVIFTSDNGPSIESYLRAGDAMPNFFRSFGPFDGIKRDCWEGGIREGAIVRWPTVIPAGRIDQTPSQFQDWMPTLASVAGVPAPARTDGVSLLPTLTGEAGQIPSTIYSEYFFNGKTPSFPEFAPAHRNRQRGQMQVLRLGDLIGVRYNIKDPDENFEIYDIVHDPQETENLAKEKPALEERMKQTVLQLRRPDASAPRPYDHELVPPDAPVQTVPGIQWQACEQSFPWLPKVDFLPVTASGSGTVPDVALLPRKNDVAMLYYGYLKVPADGSYTFALAANGKALLRIHGAAVIDEDFGYTNGSRTTEIRLKAGLHSFRLYFMPGATGAPSLDFQWSVEGDAPKPIAPEAFCRRAP